jgi:hypothetical protein
MNKDTRFWRRNKWNWGAFLLGPIWALINQVWIGLIAWLPILLLLSSVVLLFISPFIYITFYISGAFYMIIASNKLIVLYSCIFWYFITVFILGLEGNEMALRAQHRLIEHPEGFKAQQKTLSIFGFIFGLPLMYVTIYCLDYLVNLNAHLFDSV